MRLPGKHATLFLLPALLLTLPFAYGAELNTSGGPTTLDSTPGLQTNGPAGIAPAGQVFQLKALLEADGGVTLLWEFPERFYLYRKSLAVTRADGTPLALQLPEARVITDEYFGEVEVYFARLQARVPPTELNAAPGTTVELQLSYQGCAQDVYCYPLQHKTLTLQMPD